MFLYEFSVAVYNTAVSATSAPSVIFASENATSPASGGGFKQLTFMFYCRGVHCTPAETICVITEQSDFIAINERLIQHTKTRMIYNVLFLSCGRAMHAPTIKL